MAKKLRQLQLLQTNFSHELLPSSTSQVEILYQQIAEELEQKLVAELEHSRLKKQEMLEDFWNLVAPSQNTSIGLRPFDPSARKRS